MNVSFSSFLLTLLSTNLLIGFVCIITKLTAGKVYINPKYLILCSILIIFRGFLPYEFFYTVTVKSNTLLPAIQDVVNSKVYRTDITFYQLLVAVWIIGSIVKLTSLIIKQYKVEKYLAGCSFSQHSWILRDILRMKHVEKTIVLKQIQENVSPAIVGLLKPKIIMPENIPEEEAYYILLHEVEHFKQRDLYLITCLHIFCVIYWWNPLMYFIKYITLNWIELRVDMMVTENFNEVQKVNYLQCILNAAKRTIKEKSYTARNGIALGFYEKYSLLEQRFKNLVGNQNRRAGKILPPVILMFVIASTVIIAEPYQVHGEVGDNTLIIEGTNSYFIKKEVGYDLYIDGQFVLSLDSIDEFSEMPVYNYMEEVHE